MTEFSPFLNEWFDKSQKGQLMVVVPSFQSKKFIHSLYPGEDKLGTDESEFNRILASYNPVVLRATLEEYHKIKVRLL